MRPIILFWIFACLSGCSSSPGLRPEPVPIKGTVKLPGGTSPKDLTITFNPTQQDSSIGGSKVGADGTFEVSLIPGKYIPYFQDEANLRVAAYKAVPELYRKPNMQNEISVSASGVTVEVK